MNADERYAFVRRTFDGLLSEIGLQPGGYEPRSPFRGDATGCGGVTCRFIGRDPAGHAHQCEVDVPLGGDADLMLRSMESRIAPQRRSAMRVDLHPPVEPGPDMALGHLRVFAPFARRLRMDHGDGAQDALRHALAVYREGMGRKLSKHPRPYGLAMDANRVDHREELGPGAHLRGSHVVLHATVLPDQMLGGIVGQPVTRIVAHPLLDDRMTVARAFSERASARNGGGVTVLDLSGEYIPGDRI